MKLCESELPSDFGIWLSGRYLRPWNNAPQRILVIGDTGCRVTHYQWQGCNDADAWPFARVVESGIARHVDLVVHVGDYHYREKPCPDARPECKGTPWGDNWETWEAEFFGPARSLLESAFWVMARGNHEDCERAGAGWLHLLGPAQAGGTSGGCREYTDPFWARSKPGNTDQKQDQVFKQTFSVTSMLDHGSVLLTKIAPGQWVAEVLESHGQSRGICDLSAGKTGVEHYLNRTLKSDEPSDLEQYGCFIVAP